MESLENAVEAKIISSSNVENEPHVEKSEEACGGLCRCIIRSPVALERCGHVLPKVIMKRCRGRLPNGNRNTELKKTMSEMVILSNRILEMANLLKEQTRILLESNFIENE